VRNALFCALDVQLQSVRRGLVYVAAQPASLPADERALSWLHRRFGPGLSSSISSSELPSVACPLEEGSSSDPTREGSDSLVHSDGGSDNFGFASSERPAVPMSALSPHTAPMAAHAARITSDEDAA
jgi:hypothetical protein